MQSAPKGSNTSTPCFELRLSILEIKKCRIPFNTPPNRLIRGENTQGIAYLFEIAKASTRLGSNCGGLNPVYQGMLLDVQW
jgi:hypothetical protein